MTVYINVAARRIQTWISRTPDLRLVRGASKALAEKTSNEAIGVWLVESGLAEIYEVADEAGDVDGVIVLTPRSSSLGGSKSSGGPALSPEDVAWSLISHLQSELPGVEWGAWIQEGENYLHAYSDVLKDVSRHSPDRFSAFSSDVNVPPAETCRGCGLEHREVRPGQPEVPASATGTEEERLALLGPDCLIRMDSGSRDRDRLGSPKRKEAFTFPDLAAAAGEGSQPISGATSDARPAGARTRSARQRREINHLATIAADGNRLGALFQAVLTFPPELQGRAVKAVDVATHTAADQASRVSEEYLASPTLLPDIQHYLGGDDVLVSVPAPIAWRYAIVLARVFRTAMTDGWRDAADNAGLTAENMKDERERLKKLLDDVSLGIGICFSHHAHPFSDCRHQAELAQKVAKRSTRGEQSAISWIDLTVEDSVPAHRAAVVDDLRMQLDRIDGRPTRPPGPALLLQDQLLTTWTNSQLATAGEFLRDHWRPEEADTEEGQRDRNRKLVSLLTTWSDRHGGLLWEPLTADDGATDAQVAVLADLLNRERWWPKP